MYLIIYYKEELHITYTWGMLKNWVISAVGSVATEHPDPTHPNLTGSEVSWLNSDSRAIERLHCIRTHK